MCIIRAGNSEWIWLRINGMMRASRLSDNAKTAGIGK